MGQKGVLEIVTAFKSAATRNVVFSTTVQNNKNQKQVLLFFLLYYQIFMTKFRMFKNVFKFIQLFS